eukprot:CAMPEP_0171917018 /NCGR_PEP_ID=MMETSP0993-20121228/15541_1 /TAXON_ID=483369 /ORGANISM="non described non described, Strain CCMP2098" /LENGTH=162 /DNA_ID=CAMNT_0012552697 /DNA_START=520 /DNA_END=1005 /DNA_ORIENTATION=-
MTAECSSAVAGFFLKVVHCFLTFSADAPSAWVARAQSTLVIALEKLGRVDRDVGAGSQASQCLASLCPEALPVVLWHTFAEVLFDGRGTSSSDNLPFFIAATRLSHSRLVPLLLAALSSSESAATHRRAAELFSVGHSRGKALLSAETDDTGVEFLACDRDE